MKTCCFAFFGSENSALSQHRRSFAFHCAALVLVCITTTVSAQLADSFDPNANDSVRIIVVQPDGKILLGGDFTSLSPNGGPTVNRNYIARLNPDGTVDTAFDAHANGGVRSIALQADGKVLVGGDFNGPNSIGGQTRNYIARLDSATGLADSFDPNADYGVQAIAIQADSKILAAGFFTAIGGQPRNRIARLDAATGLADSFDPNANADVDLITVQPDGKILVGGGFCCHSDPNPSIGGQPRTLIARLDPITGLADPVPTALDALPLSIVLQPDAKVWVGKHLTDGPDSFFRANPDWTLDTTLAVYALDSVHAIALQADGKILVGGEFNTIYSRFGAGRWIRYGIARLNLDTTVDDSFDPNVGGVRAIAVQTDGKILIGGVFFGPNSVGNTTRNHIARLYPNTPIPPNCVSGLGYWMNHPQAWCMEQIVIGERYYSQTDAIAIMRHKSGRDKTYLVAQQLIAARLNLACKRSYWGCISWPVAAADSWLRSNPVGSGVLANSAAWQEIKATYNELAKYNDGKLCVPTCHAMP